MADKIEPVKLYAELYSPYVCAQRLQAGYDALATGVKARALLAPAGRALHARRPPEGPGALSVNEDTAVHGLWRGARASKRSCSMCSSPWCSARYNTGIHAVWPYVVV